MENLGQKQWKRTTDFGFNRAKAWDAYLLLDEADVFLAARDQDDLARNGLVAGMSAYGSDVVAP